MQRFKATLLSISIAFFGSVGSGFFTNDTLGIAAVPGEWEATGNMLNPRKSHHVLLLNDGRVLVTGGLNSAGDPVTGTELYDYTTGTFSAGGNMMTARWQHRDALQLTGQVLIAGGRDVSGNVLNSAELFDPVSGLFSPTGNMQRFRRLHRSTTLANGKVLVAGGAGGTSNTNNNTLFSAELYDPATGTFTFTAGNMLYRRRGHMQILLNNGRVLIVGGFGGLPSNNSNIDAVLNTAELYDPDTNTFSATGNMVVPRQGPFITKLPDGKVLVLGGHDQAENPLVSAEIYDPATGTFSATGNPSTGRFGGRIAVLTNGQILYIGGQTSTSESDVTNTTELFNPATGTFSATGNLVTARSDGYPTLLPNGQVLYVGGVNAAGTTLKSAELYTPLMTAVPADFDGDGTSDVAVFRGGVWLFHDFASGAQNGGIWTGPGSGCIPVAMDYDGDGTKDFTTFCNGAWYFSNADGTYNKGIWTGGAAGDVPVPADYDGDGRDDVVVYRGGNWFFFDFATGAWDAAKSRWTGGGAGCIPVPMDHDGDGRADFTTFCNGAWYFSNADGSYNKGIWTGGAAGNVPVAADYDGDGRDDVVVYQGGNWFFFDFATGAWDAAKSRWTGGGAGCIPAPIDYDGDGAVDFATFCNGAWYFHNDDGSYNRGIWTGGVPGDQPISRRLLP